MEKKHTCPKIEIPGVCMCCGRVYIPPADTIGNNPWEMGREQAEFDHEYPDLENPSIEEGAENLISGGFLRRSQKDEFLVGYRSFSQIS